MAIYIFPIFLFGCAITGIVLIGLQQASDWAKDEAIRINQKESGLEKPAPRPTSYESKPGDSLNALR